MGFVYDIYTSLSTRELATITLIIAFLTWGLSIKGFRHSIWEIIKICLYKQLVISAGILFSIIIGGCYFLHTLGYWEACYTKDVILYSFAALPLLFKVIKHRTQYAFEDMVFENITSAAFISAYLNIHTCNYFAELAWQILFLIYSLSTLSLEIKRESHTPLYISFQRVKAFLIVLLLIYVAYRTFTTPLRDSVEMLSVSIGLPLILTIFISPYLYLYALCATYESWFTNLIIRTDDRRDRIRKGIKLICVCGLNLDKVSYLRHRIKQFIYGASYEEFSSCVDMCNIHYHFIKMRQHFR